MCDLSKLPNEVSVTCRMNGSDVQNFTDGKIYTAVRVESGSGRLFEVKDDRGLYRYILPNEKCPHLVKRLNNYWGQESVGVFEVVQ